MSYTYRPRGMPARFLVGAPKIVCDQVIDILANDKHAVCEYDVCFRYSAHAQEMVGLDFASDGGRGCHFFLKPHEMRAYRERNRRKRVAWRDLPEATRAALVAYLEWDPAK